MNLLSPDLWNNELPWGNTLAPYFCVAREENVSWFPNTILFHNRKEFVQGWYRDKNWQKVQVTADYSYGMIVSVEQFFHGIYTMVCKLPNFRGSFPAFWFYDIIPPPVGIQCEMDVMEHFRKDARWLGTRHKLTCTYHDKDKPDIIRNRWSGLWPWDGKEVEIQFVWQPDRLCWIINGREVMEIKRGEVEQFPDKPMNVIVNSGLGQWNVQNDKLEPLIVNQFRYDEP